MSFAQSLVIIEKLYPGLDRVTRLNIPVTKDTILLLIYSARLIKKCTCLFKISGDTCSNFG